MQRSLTVLLPVHNAQSTLSATVTEVLEMVSDDGQSRRFELVIVDDGSSDATSEVVDELMQSYPQVRSVRHGTHQGREAAIRAGLRHSRGEEVMLLHEADHAQPRPRLEMLCRRSPMQGHESSRPAKPNYLARLKKFTLGE